MIRKLIAFTLLMLLAISLVAKSNEVQFKFKVNSQEEINKLSGLISIDKVDGNIVHAYANQTELLKFEQLNYNYSIVPKPDRTNLPMANSVTEMRSWDCYPTYETYVDLMYEFATDHSDICSVTSIGQSIDGREILVANISDYPGVDENEPEFFYTGQIHGNELVSFIMLLHLIDYLTENYGTNDRITNIVDNIDIYINPLSNPDGTYAGGNNNIWEATRNNANSVDLNRNFPDPEDGPHPDGNEWQPENIIMMDFAEEHNFVMSSNLHSGTEVLNYPWDTWEHLTADDDWWQEVCHTYADTVHLYSPANYLNGFDNGITNGFQWYSISGGRQDYMNYFHRCREMTLELSEEKLLPENELIPHWNYNRQSFLLYMEECLYGLRGVVTNSSGEPILAEITMLGHDMDNSEVFTDPAVGNYHRLLYPGTYDAEYDAWGYFPEVVTNIQITDNDVVVENVMLDPSPAFTINGTISNFFNSEPIQNAEIIILDTPLETVISNENGEFEIECVYEDSYQIQVYAEGFSKLIQEIDVNESSTTFDLQLFECDVENFETGDFTFLPWTFSGSVDWMIDPVISFEGTHSARSGVIQDDRDTSILITMTTSYDGILSFYRKVSSEAGWDWLTFYIDEEEMDTWSGELDWEEFSYFIDAGEHTFKWIYAKDSSVSNGDDCGWIDWISFPPTNVLHAANEVPPIINDLLGNFPNPFNPQTEIMFQLAEQKPVELSIYNIKGQKVKILLKEEREAGLHSVVWNGTDNNNRSVASGVYFYKLKLDKIVKSKKMMLLK